MPGLEPYPDLSLTRDAQYSEHRALLDSGVSGAWYPDPPADVDGSRLPEPLGMVRACHPHPDQCLHCSASRFSCRLGVMAESFSCLHCFDVINTQPHDDLRQ